MGEVRRPARSREADWKDSGKIVSADHGRSHDAHGGHLHHVLEERTSPEVFRRGRSGSGLRLLLSPCLLLFLVINVFIIIFVVVIIDNIRDVSALLLLLLSRIRHRHHRSLLWLLLLS